MQEPSPPHRARPNFQPPSLLSLFFLLHSVNLLEVPKGIVKVDRDGVSAFWSFLPQRWGAGVQS